MDAIDLSTKTFGKIKQNLAWAFGYNIVGIPIAAGALLPAYGLALTPSVAGAVMGVSSIGVMVNSLLLQLEGRKFSKKIKTKILIRERERGRHYCKHARRLVYHE